MATKDKTETTSTDNGAVMSKKNGDELENMNPGVRFANALSAALLDIENHSVIQAHTLAELARARKGKNSALLNATQAKWTVDQLTSGKHDPTAITQVLTILGNMPTDQSTTATHSPAEILATRLWVLAQTEADIRAEYAPEVDQEAWKLLNGENFQPILADDKRDTVIANTVRAAKTGTMPRGKAAVAAKAEADKD